MTDQRETPIYHIRVKGRLDEKWADWFEGFVMSTRESGETLLSGPVVDQAALHGVLNKLHSLSLTLLMVIRIDCPCTTKNCSRHGQCAECAAHHCPHCFRAKTKWDRQCIALIEKT